MERSGFNSMQNNFILSYFVVFLVFLRYVKAMYKFGVFLRLWVIVFVVSKLNKVFGKGFEEWNQNWKVLGCGWIIGFGKLTR